MEEPKLDIPSVRRSEISWARVLERERFLPLPAAHDALTARLIERAGFSAYQIGGFALAGTRYGTPDVDIEHFGEKSRAVQQIIESCELPALVDCDDGYGDAKNVTRTVRGYEALGAAALFIEDQTAPKRCGHMAGKTVIPQEAMVSKIRAALCARQDAKTFVIARTDAIEPEGLPSALRRAEAYLAAGADGIYVEGPRNKAELIEVGRELGHAPLATSVLERGGVTPWLPPSEFQDLGYAMVLYPVSILFRVAKAIERASAALREGEQLDAAESVDMKQFEDLVDLGKWAAIEERFPVKTH